MSETRRRLLWLFGASLILRLLYIGAGIEVPPQDTPDYDEIAHNLLAGEGFVASSNWFGHELRAWRAPLYPLLLAAVYAVWDSHVAVQVVQPQKVDLRRTTTQPGTVHAFHEAEIYAKVSGYLMALDADIGDEVKAAAPRAA